VRTSRRRRRRRRRRRKKPVVGMSHLPENPRLSPLLVSSNQKGLIRGG